MTSGLIWLRVLHLIPTRAATTPSVFLFRTQNATHIYQYILYSLPFLWPVPDGVDNDTLDPLALGAFLLGQAVGNLGVDLQRVGRGHSGSAARNLCGARGAIGCEGIVELAFAALFVDWEVLGFSMGWFFFGSSSKRGIEEG